MKALTTALSIVVLVGSPAFACYDLLGDNGTMSFDYEQVGGGISGSFASVGPLQEDPPNEGTGAATFVLNTTHYLVVVGAVEDGLNYTDGGIIVISDVVPITTGVYALGGNDAIFVQIDDAVGWEVPVDLCATNWFNELEDIIAAGKYGSTSGSVSVDELSSDGTSGTFSAVVHDPDTGIDLNVTSGEFNVLPPVSVDPSSWTWVKGLYR